MNTSINLTNEAVERLRESGYQPGEFPLLCLAPLVRLAWAEGRAQKAEQRAILRIAAKLGITKNHAHYGDLLEWLAERPTDAFFDEANAILREILDILPPGESDGLRQILEAGCEAVAGAAPDVGFFRYRSSVTPEERDEIGRFNQSFGLRPGSEV